MKRRPEHPIAARTPAPGTRVRLVLCTDEWTKLPPGSMGTVDFVDSIGTVHVRWDDGSRLGLVPGHDAWEVVVASAPDEASPPAP